MAIKWFIKAVVVYWSIEWIWRSSWVQSEILQPYTRVLAWQLEQILRILGYEVARNVSFLFVKGFPYGIQIVPRCLGFLGGGFFLFLAAVLTLPSSSPLRTRIYWLVSGLLVLTAANILRITVVIVVSCNDPPSFELFHSSSIHANVLVGGVLALLAVRSLTLNPMGIKVFRRSTSKDVPESGRGADGQ